MKDKDIKKVEKLIELMEEKGLNELEIKKPFLKIYLKRESPFKEIRPQIIKEEKIVTPQKEEIKEEIKKEIKEEKEDRFYYILAPLVGTFYRAPAPDAEPYVDVGTRVRPGQVVCIIEAMKIMNEIESEVEGIIKEILVKNGEPVEYGQKLFKIELI